MRLNYYQGSPNVLENVAWLTFRLTPWPTKKLNICIVLLMYCTSCYLYVQWGLWDQERLAKYSLHKRLVLSRLIPVGARGVNLVADGQGLDPQVGLITMTNGSRLLQWKVWKVLRVTFIIITIISPLRLTLSNISLSKRTEWSFLQLGDKLDCDHFC